MSVSITSGDNAGQGKSVDSAAGNSIEFENSLTLTIAELFYPTYKRFFEGEDFIDELADDLKQANINRPVEIYTSGALGYGTIIGAFLGLIVSAFVYLTLQAVLSIPRLPAEFIPFSDVTMVLTIVQILGLFRFPAAALIVGLIGGLIGFFAALTLAIYYPKYVKRKRARHIDLMMGDALAFMYSLSVGGTNQVKVMESVANAEDAYGEVSVEFQRIVYQMKYFNIDYKSAVQEVAEVTPSDELEAFLTDMLSVIDSGGDMTSFLDTQQEHMRERGRKKQEELLDTLEFFGEMYMSLNVLPMGLLIVLVIISMMGTPQLSGLYITVYGILPGLNIIFGLLIATVKKDEIGDGTLDTEGQVAAIGEDETKLRSLDVIDHYVRGDYGSFYRPIRRSEFQYRLGQILRSPWEYFRLHPPYVLLITVPLTVLVMVLLVASGLANPSPRAFVVDPYIQAVMWFYVPVFMIITPLAFFYEWNLRTRGKITDTLTGDLRKFANANETGQPVLDSMRMTATGKDSMLSEEFERMYKKTKFGASLSPVLVEFNNRYRIPRLARTVKLIQKAQEASSNITEVLKTAARTSEYQDELEKDRLQRTRMQVAVTGLTFLVFLGVILMLEVYFMGEMIGSVGEEGMPMGGFEAIETSLISMLFFHSITIQALCAGIISGYVQTGKIYSGYKYVVMYMLIAALSWGWLAV